MIRAAGRQQLPYHDAVPRLFFFVRGRGLSGSGSTAPGKRPYLNPTLSRGEREPRLAALRLRVILDTHHFSDGYSAPKPGQSDRDDALSLRIAAEPVVVHRALP